MLTGKAKSDFIEYHYNQLDFTKESHEENYEMFLHQTEVTHQLASIIEWFDSVGYIIHTHFDIETKLWCYEVFDNKLYDILGESIFYDENIKVCIVEMDVYQCRQQATEQAIIKANEIYNSQ